jgi:hypothetical protein
MRDISLNAAVAQKFRIRRIFFNEIRFIDIVMGSAILSRFRWRSHSILLKYVS